MTNPQKGPRLATQQKDAEYRDFFVAHAHCSQKELGELLGWTRKTIERFDERNPDIPRNHRRGGVGERNGSWKGGRVVDKDGYILIRLPEHPHADNHGYMREHRLVMEKMVGRYLEAQEVVHHRNSDKGDNRPENLELLEDNSQNIRYAWQGQRHSLETRQKMSQAAQALWNQRLDGQPAATPRPSRLDAPR